MITALDLKKVLDEYLADVNESKDDLREMAEEAEENDDYYDYDQASYDHYEFLAERGEWLAQKVAEYLNNEWSIK